MKKFIIILSLFMVLGLTACGETTTEATTAAPTTEAPTTTVEEFNTNASIQIYTRDTTSGTREAFFKGIDFSDAVDDNQFLATGYVEVDGNGSMISSVNGDEFGIGYVSLSSLEESGLIGLNFEGVEPTEANVLNDTYGLKRPFNYIVRDDWTGMETEEQIVKAFLAYMGTIDGKATIQANSGILSIETTDQSWDDIKANYPVCSADNSAVTINFGGSTSVEKIARALSEEFSGKCGNFIADHNHTGSGDGYKRTQGEEADGANKIHIGFASRGLKLDSSEPAVTGTYGQICWDAVVIVVNGVNNVIANITTEDIKKIYDGTFTTWSDLLA
ncbi:substrate-binding domain-containing protein [Candidatus Izemoplasma sp. B36]|uniref:substrate-binding domain-containing protein n=1 Tax=Candidatus Izemoplasma sp. B36 TaxID=3242468 RepID=UPI003556B7EC